MSLLDVRSTIVSHYKALFPTVNVVAHGGRMSLEEIQRWSTGSPALVVACLGVPSVDIEGGMSVANSAWAIAVIARIAHQDMLQRDAVVLALVAPILAELPLQRWNGFASKMPKQIKAENAYSTALDKIGASLWAITWLQGVDLPTITDVTTLADWLRSYPTYVTTDNLPSTVPAVDHQVLQAFTSPSVTTTSLPNGHVGVAYSTTLAGANGNAPYVWAVTVGSLPAGLALNTSTGVISGTPTGTTVDSFTVQLTDTFNVTASQPLTLTVVTP